MPSIRDLYTYYLTADHLQGRAVVVHIQSVAVEELWNRQLKRRERKLILRFHSKKLALACNKTQAAALEQLTGSDDYTHWPGHAITLSPGRAPTGADTILITAASNGDAKHTVNGNGKATVTATVTTPAASEHDEAEHGDALPTNDDTQPLTIQSET